MALQDLLMKVASKEGTLGSEIEFGTFTWAVKILSRYDLNATIAQVLLSLSNIVNFVAIIILLKISFIKANVIISCLSKHLKEQL